MNYVVSYREGNLKSAAEHVFQHNPYAQSAWGYTSAEQVEEEIKRHFMKRAEENAVAIEEDNYDEWCGWSSTGGWICIFSHEEDSNAIDVEIYVSPIIHSNVVHDFVEEPLNPPTAEVVSFRIFDKD